MASLTNYRGLDVIDGGPVGAGGAAIQDNFVSLVDWGPKSVWAQTADPTVNDDAGDEFYPGSLWLRTNVTPAKLFVCKTSAPGAAVWTQIGGVPDVFISSKSANYTAVAADKGNLILCTSALTLSFTAAATLGAGWWCYYQNVISDNTTYVTLDPNASELIDGLSSYRSYRGELRKIICTGTGFYTLLLKGGEALFTADSTFIVPPGGTVYRVSVVGGGGGGGGGQGGTAGTIRGGGSGGGGGARAQNDFTAAELGGEGTSISLTVALQTSAGVTTGPAGGTSRFGANDATYGGLLEAFGGGGGVEGFTANNLRGGGGGGTGNTGNFGGTAVIPGAVPGLFSSVAAGGGGAGVPTAGSYAINAEYGGASGGGCPAGGEGAPGGISQYGGAGGGGGGGVSAANVHSAGSGGGRTASYLIGWGGGSAAGTAGGGTGGNGSVRNTGRSGTGGGGGGGNAAGAGGAGGNGAAPGGGGGGGGGGLTAGLGGRGARGEVRVRYWP